MTPEDRATQEATGQEGERWTMGGLAVPGSGGDGTYTVIFKGRKLEIGEKVEVVRVDVYNQIPEDRATGRSQDAKAAVKALRADLRANGPINPYIDQREAERVVRLILDAIEARP